MGGVQSGWYRVGGTERVVQRGWYREGGTEWEWGEYTVGGRDSTQ